MAATMCTLSPFTPSTDQPCGVVMSEVISMNSALAKLLGVKPGHQAIMIHANMGDVNSWTARSKDSSWKRSKQWKFNTNADGWLQLLVAAASVRPPAHRGSRLPRWGAEVGSPAPPLRGAGSTPGESAPRGGGVGSPPR